jgi:hypothetical protein
LIPTFATEFLSDSDSILDVIKIDEISLVEDTDIKNDNKEVNDVNKDDQNKTIFTDLKGHWAEANIQILVNKGVISGYPDGSFRPENTISRAEFATVLVKAFNLTGKQGKVFNDTSAHWAKDYISIAYSHKIVNGINELEFAPDANITREQMALMIVNASKLATSSNSKLFSDHNHISSWAVGAVNTAVSNGIISGYPDNSFRPQGSAKRGEAVTLMVNVL